MSHIPSSESVSMGLNSSLGPSEGRNPGAPSNLLVALHQQAELVHGVLGLHSLNDASTECRCAHAAEGVGQHLEEKTGQCFFTREKERTRSSGCKYWLTRLFRKDWI